MNGLDTIEVQLLILSSCVYRKYILILINAIPDYYSNVSREINCKINFKNYTLLVGIANIK